MEGGEEHQLRQTQPAILLNTFKLNKLVLLTVLFSLSQLHETSGFHLIKHIIRKRESSLTFLSAMNEKSFESSNNGVSTRGRGQDRSRKVDDGNMMSFGQLVMFAQEEAKCLQRFGGQRFSTSSPAPQFISKDFYSPILCSKNSNQFAQCEICRNLTTRPRTKEECSLFCAKVDSFCPELCFSINNAVSAGAHVMDRIPNLKGESNESMNDSSDDERFIHFDNVSHLHNRVFSQIPQVFCEGVLEDNAALSNNKNINSNKKQVSIEEREQWDLVPETTNHFVVLKWNVQQSHEEQNDLGHNHNSEAGETLPVIFVIEKYSASSGKWEALGKTLYNLQTINVTFLSDNYKWRITAVSPTGIVDEVTSETYSTLNGYIKPGHPLRIYVMKTIPVDSNSSVVNVLIGWDPPKEKACFYKIVLETHEGAEKPIRIKEPLGVHQHWFSLQAETQYSILITSRGPSWDHHSESNLTRLDFKTPTCLESYSYRFDKCAPPPPRDIESKIHENTEDSTIVRVEIFWKPPQNASESNPVLHYNVTLTRLNFKNGESMNGINSIGSTKSQLNLNGTFPYMNFSGSAFSKLMRPSSRSNSNSNYTTVSGNTTQIQFPGLEANAEYHIVVRAVSSRGSSIPAQHHFLTKIVIEPPVASTLNNWIYLVILVCTMMFILFACNMGQVYLQKRKVKRARNQYFQSMEERDALSADWSIIPLTEDTSTWKLFDDNFPKEKWEIASENLIMGEVIGQGAFGVVRRAKIPRKKLQCTTLKYLEKANPYHDGERSDLDMETVAVKMLKVSATIEDREQLVKEIMTMQSLGFHPQIVGLIGACTRGRSLSLVLEYCSGGDLLTFIRNVRAKYWPTLGLSEAKRSTSLSSLSREASCRSGSGGSGGTRPKNLNFSDCCNHDCEDSPINYADLEHFSYSSSPKSDQQGNPIQPSEKQMSPKSSQNHSRRSSQNVNDKDSENFRPIDEKDVLSYARQIAMGMEYLEKNRIVHRDLACRNCLLMNDRKQVKLSDFGLSRDIYTWNVYHQKSNGKLPIKWMAIESIFTHVFTTKSDVWSYGIILWELVTLGGTPYPGLGNTELFHLLKSGYRMERPDNSSEELYALMKKCWRTSPAARPTFTELRNYVQNMMEAAEPNLYLSLMADIPSDYFRLGSRSDLHQMNVTTNGSMDLYKGSCASNMSQNSRKYAGYHNTKTTYPLSSTLTNHYPVTSPPAPNTNANSGPIDLQSSNASAKYSSLNNKGESSRASCSRSNSNSGNGTSNSDSSDKLVLESVPEGRSNYQCDNNTQTNASSDLSAVVGESPETDNNNSVTKYNHLLFERPSTGDASSDLHKHDKVTRKITKSVSTTLVDGVWSISTTNLSDLDTPLTTKSPSSLQFPYPFRQLNSMTIIENRSYGLADN